MRLNVIFVVVSLLKNSQNKAHIEQLLIEYKVRQVFENKIMATFELEQTLEIYHFLDFKRSVQMTSYKMDDIIYSNQPQYQTFHIVETDMMQ